MLYGPYYILVEIWNLLTPMVIFHVLWATFVGTVVGMLPGLTATMGIALLTGLTFGMDPEVRHHHPIVRLRGRHHRGEPLRHPAEHPGHPGQRGRGARRLPARPARRGRPRHRALGHLLLHRDRVRDPVPGLPDPAARTARAEVPVMGVLLARHLRGRGVRQPHGPHRSPQGVDRRLPGPDPVLVRPGGHRGLHPLRLRGGPDARGVLAHPGARRGLRPGRGHRGHARAHPHQDPQAGGSHPAALGRHRPEQGPHAALGRDRCA